MGNNKRKTDRDRANNTYLYVYSNGTAERLEMATMKDDVLNYINTLKGGERFLVERRHFMGEWNPQKIYLTFEVEKVYPHFVMCIGPNGRRQGLTFQDVYFGLHNKTLE